MKMPELTLKQLHIEPNRRILVTSDIHGQQAFLQNLLEKARFSDADLLIIVGDMIEKGPESLKTLRYVMKLCERGNVIPLIGNVDAWRLHMINQLNPETLHAFYSYLLMCRAHYGTSFSDEMAKEVNHFCTCPEDLLLAKPKVISHFQPELDFLAACPTILQSQRYVFVHGGLRDENIEENLNRNLFDLLKYDHFMDTDQHFDPYIVVGHWPVSLYNDQVPQYNPIIHKEKHIIAIDGGCSIKHDGQLNLLILPSIDCDIDEVDYMSYDKLPHFVALTDQQASKNSIYIRWSDGPVEIIERQGDFLRVEHKSTGRKLWIYKDHINDASHTDCTDYELPVKKGDPLSLVQKTSRGYIVKKNGVRGWYRGDLIPLESH